MEALTEIKHGKEDGTVVHLDPGDKVKKGDFTEKELAALVEVGAVGGSFEEAAAASVPQSTTALTEPPTTEPPTTNKPSTTEPSKAEKK